jgi:hypothetical protein
MKSIRIELDLYPNHWFGWGFQPGYDPLDPDCKEKHPENYIDIDKTIDAFFDQYPGVLDHYVIDRIQLLYFPSQFAEGQYPKVALCDNILYIDIYYHEFAEIVEENRQLKQDLKNLAEKYNVG